jgi:hypothetical protein
MEKYAGNGQNYRCLNQLLVLNNMTNVFISYVQENSNKVMLLADALKKQGIRVWLDKDELLPGTKWKHAIKDAIHNGDFFIACFSKEYCQRIKTYMNEELTIAIEALRLRPANNAWFIPIVFDDCDVPDRSIGAGEMLSDIHRVNLSINWDTGIKKLIQVILTNELKIEKFEIDAKSTKAICYNFSFNKSHKSQKIPIQNSDNQVQALKYEIDKNHRLLQKAAMRGDFYLCDDYQDTYRKVVIQLKNKFGVIYNPKDDPYV